MAYVDNGDDELDYEDDEFGERGATTGSGYSGGAIAALADEDVEDEEDFEDLYNDVNVDFFPAPPGLARQSSGRFKGAENGAAAAAAPSAVKVEFAEDEDDDRAGDASYVEEQAYQERGQETGARAPTLGSRRTQAAQGRSGEGVYGQQSFGQAGGRGPGSVSLISTSKPKEENQEFVDGEASAVRASGVSANQRPPVPKGNHGQGEFGGRTGAAGDGAGAVVKEEQYGEADSQTQGAAGVAKAKEEPEYGSGQQGVYGKSALGRGSKASAGAGAGGINGAHNSEPPGGGKGVVKPVNSQSQAWVAPVAKVGGTSQAGGGALPPPVAAPSPVKDSATVASDYMAKHGGGNQLETGGTMLFVGELHWWTTDAELEAVLLEFGRVKNLKFFEEKASGKSKGYCQVEFFDAAAARMCKEKMDGRVFNGRSCVVAFASPQTIKQMGAAQVGKNQQAGQGQSQQGGQGQGKKLDGGMGSRGGAGAGGVDNRGRMGMGRTQGPGMGGRTGQGPGRGRGGLGGRGVMGAGAPFGQGPPGPMGGPPGGMMPPQGMMGQGFDPGFGPPMGRGGYGMGPGGFVPRGPPGHFPGMGPPFPGMGPGLPAVGPHVNPAFFGRGQNGTGPGMGPTGMEGHPGAWGEGPMHGWGGEELDRRMGVYGEDMGGADYGYGGDMVPDRMRARERERGAEGEWTASDRRRRVEERDGDWDRDRHRERDREGYRDALDRTREPRERPREREKDKEWEERERPSRGREKPRVGDDDERPRSRDDDYGKRRKVSQGERKVDR